MKQGGEQWRYSTKEGIKMSMRFTLMMLLLIASCNSSQKENKASNNSKSKLETIKCDQFEIEHKINEKEELCFKINTDLPEFVTATVSVSRVYKEEGNSEDYSVDYYSKKSTPISFWKENHCTNISDESLKKVLGKKQSEHSHGPLKFHVSEISNFVSISAVVHLNQKDKRIGKGNENLKGKAVKKFSATRNIVDNEAKIEKPVQKIGDVISFLRKEEELRR